MALGPMGYGDARTVGFFNQDDLMEAVQAARPDADLLTAPIVQGELREALARRLLDTPGDYPGDEEAHKWALHMIDALLPTINAYVAEKSADMAEKAWGEGFKSGYRFCESDGFDDNVIRNPYSGL
ncbi:hypothetical protein EF847_01420 [Actinobacteria bacterium YIM 96077]|uniref:Uncharacterized protein n=1 Tax=Phytoactinopolyspora halophila TaxID=1981511 RepID=A0A329QFI6_9ACTN|nr:hypothetical protein EF847_01420 [Actinobacteria bacterium YIM 96077]RAW11127.1 hypothetical protein DPM12_17445 [Phytoactinopolyspora halophila]